MNESMNMTVNSTIHGTGNMTAEAVTQGAQVMNGNLLDTIAGTLNWLVSLAGFHMAIGADEVGILLFVATILLAWFKLRAFLDLLKTWLGVVVALVAIYLVLTTIGVI